MSSSVETGSYPEGSFIDNPGYYEFVRESYYYFRRQLGSDKPLISWDSIQNDLSLLGEGVKGVDILVALGAILVIAYARKSLTNHVFIPVCRWRKLPEAEAESVPESGWKLVFYLFTSIAITAYMIQDGWSLLNEPKSAWKGYSLQNHVESGIYWIHMIELGYYLNALYTTLAVDRYRKDTPAMMIHHVVSILLILGSFTTRTHKVGIVTLFLHDICDVFLEGAKLLRYFKVQNGRTYHFLESFVVVGFAGFLTSWMINRLYLFPLRVVYFSIVYSEHFRLPFYFALISMFMVIQLLNVYWFTFIVRLLYRVVTGQARELEDTVQLDKPEVGSNSLKTATQQPEIGSLSPDSGVDSDQFRSASESSSSRSTPEPEVDDSEPETAFQETVLRHRK